MSFPTEDAEETAHNNNHFPFPIAPYPDSPTTTVSAIKAGHPPTRLVPAQITSEPLHSQHEQRSGVEESISHNRFQTQVSAELRATFASPAEAARGTLMKIIAALSGDDQEFAELLRDRRSRVATHINPETGAMIIDHKSYSLVPQTNKRGGTETAAAILKEYCTTPSQPNLLWEVREILHATRHGIEEKKGLDIEKFALLHEYCSVALELLPTVEQTKGTTTLQSSPPSPQR